MDRFRSVPQIISYDHNDVAKHHSWCLANNIKIYFKPLSNYNGVIVVEENNEPIEGFKVYKSITSKLTKKDENWSDVIKRLYTEHYFKHNPINK